MSSNTNNRLVKNPGQLRELAAQIANKSLTSVDLRNRVKAFIEADANPERGLCGGPAEAQCEDEAAPARRQVHFAGESDIANARGIITPPQLEVLSEILPTV